MSVLRIVLVGALLLFGAGTQALAQQAASDSTSQAAEGADQGPGHRYQRTEVMGPDGKLHFIYVRPNANGYASILPYQRNIEATWRALSQPLNISLDKVKWMKVAGLYQEHMVLKGKPQRILATRLVDGPVELFNHTQVDPMVIPLVPGAGLAAAVIAGAAAGGALAAAGAGGIKERHWYLRRDGELVKVARGHFIEQLSAYFADDAEVVAALTREQVRYQDMVAIVQAYNQHRAVAPAPTGR